MADLKIYIQNRETGALIPLHNAMPECSVTWNRKNSAGKFTGSFYNREKIYIPKGSYLLMYVDGVPFYRGVFFTNQIDRWDKTNIECYDSLRYLKAKDSFFFNNLTAIEILNKFAEKFDFNIGTLDATDYKIPFMTAQNIAYFDIINKALELTLINTGQIYNLYDDFGKIRITNMTNMMSDVKLVKGSNILDYKYKGTIDKETYNSICYVLDLEATGKEQIIGSDKISPEKSDENIRKWGLLQYYEKVDESLNKEQIKEMAKYKFILYNRELKTFSLEALGTPKLRAGNLVYIDVGMVDNTNITGYQLIDSITHNFTNGVHKMSIQTREMTPLTNWNNIRKDQTSNTSYSKMSESGGTGYSGGGIGGGSR